MTYLSPSNKADGSARSGVSVSAVSRMIFGPATDRVMAVLGAFFDDSGTHADSPFVVIGGLIGNEDQWESFDQEWRSILAEPLPGKPPLKQFHLSPCRAGKGAFKDYTQAERDHLTYRFRQVILKNQLVSVSAAVNKLAWDELVFGGAREALGQPEEMCFVKCVDLVIGLIRSRTPQETVWFIFDQGRQDQLESWARFYVAQADRYPELQGIAFSYVALTPPLQGADMIATESFQYAKVWAKDGADATPNPHFRDFQFRDLSIGLVFDRENILEMLKSYHAAKQGGR